MNHSKSYITPDELFDRVAEIIRTDTDNHSVNKIMHETLVLICAEGLKETRHGFGNLSSQVDVLCKMHHVKPAHCVAIQKMRRDSNSSRQLSNEEIKEDGSALAIFISMVFDVQIPSLLTPKLSFIKRKHHVSQHIDYKYIRCIVEDWDEKYIYVTVDQDDSTETLTVDYVNTEEYIDLTYLKDLLHVGTQLNLLDCSVKNGVAIPRIVVVEPDYLLEISSIAACFEDYGHHPLSFVLNKMKPRANSPQIILGNFAGNALDDIINNKNYQINDTIKNNFREKALEYCTCQELNIVDFKEKMAEQVKNIQQIVDDLFQTYERDKAILEPSFVCERLGIQGRVDLMTTDMKLLVEQKSGRNMYLERKSRNKHGSFHVEKHYVQVLLYYGILAYNFQVSRKDANIHLLYSKYPLPNGLLEVQPLQKLMLEAIKFRNQVVASEYEIAQNGFEHVIDQLTPETLNEEHLNDFFFNRYQLPNITNTTAPLHSISPMERAYFCRMITFVTKEQLLGKVGSVEGTGNSNADLWNMPLAEKKETGNIYTELTIIRKEKSVSSNGYDTITLSIPDQGDDFLPNFRRSDMIYLYNYQKGEEPDVRKNILYQGAIAELSTKQITVHLNDGQQNESLFNDHLPYAIEHASSDIGGNSAISGLHHFISSIPDRKALLLGQRPPTCDKNKQLTRNYHPNYDEILQKAKQANDYFLLVGPPGTGKTSMALRFLVQEEFASSSSSILLMAYTNRAVDEICSMLCSANIDFIRLGNEYSCDPRFKSHLLSNALEECPKLTAIRAKIEQTRVIVGTTSTLSARPLIFDIKHFSLAIIDEASQILEPNIIGLLSMHHQTCDIDKFILIGDYKQLPAVVRQNEKDTMIEDPMLNAIGLQDGRNSLFERLIKTEKMQKRGDFIGILRKQGRMHPDIAEFPNMMFYREEKLEPVPCEHQMETALNYTLPSEDTLDERLKKHRMIFIPSKTCRKPELSDKVNTEEARIVADIVRRIYRFYGERFNPNTTIGIIVPYRNQIAIIRKEIEKWQIPSLNQISIDTVERYQGSQRDVIVYSFTIQHRYQLAFLTANSITEDNGQVIDRKLNVAITRARKQMIITGHEETLSKNETFRKFIDFIKEKEKKC